MSIDRDPNTSDVDEHRPLLLDMTEEEFRSLVQGVVEELRRERSALPRLGV